MFIAAFAQDPSTERSATATPMTDAVSAMPEVGSSVTPGTDASNTSSNPKAQKVDVKTRGVDPDGSIVQVKQLGSSGTISEVLYQSGPKTVSLGTVNILVDNKTGNTTLRAQCKKHSKCICWISSSSNVDVLLDWLAEGRRNNHDSHLNLARELKKGLGMKVRK